MSTTPGPAAPCTRADAVRVVELETENEQLRRAILAHAEVDQALGVIMAVGRLDPDEAWDVLRELSMRTNTKLRRAAQQLIGWVQGGCLDTAVRAELERQLLLLQCEPGKREVAGALAENGERGD